MMVSLRSKHHQWSSTCTEEFGVQIIGYGGFQEWPLHSPDLIPMDFLLVGIPVTPPPTSQDLQRRITDAFVNVIPAMLHREIQARVQMCIVADGEKFEHQI
ncbi:hypothetical protein AVEN_185459-1 [Araneus ventricosus]|uniref:Uncharacterized protein n=1 Tax=Araneus ventricosus TaxID=182803 RepID=A0A4Y2UIF2_ARAVE|nr:hypothetical protein AVEN_185459-1 [Araneus ventricosus]